MNIDPAITEIVKRWKSDPEQASPSEDLCAHLKPETRHWVDLNNSAEIWMHALGRPLGHWETDPVSAVFFAHISQAYYDGIASVARMLAVNKDDLSALCAGSIGDDADAYQPFGMAGLAEAIEEERKERLRRKSASELARVRAGLEAFFSSTSPEEMSKKLDEIQGLVDEVRRMIEAKEKP